MTAVGFHASHELFRPGYLLRTLQRAGRVGFGAAMCSDHFHPWTPDQGNSGFSFAWLGAALQATTLPLGTICCPFGRYHPAVVAQAAATLADMFPGRFWLALGTGQALNESITGAPWPEKPERRARVRESAEVIRALWAGETVTHSGRVRVQEAKLYTRPEAPPPLFGAATTAETAEWVGGWADGLLTVSAEPDALAEVVEAFRWGGGAGKPMYAQALVGYDPDEARAWQSVADRWAVAALGQDDLQNLPNPVAMAAAAGRPTTASLKEKGLRVSADPKRHADWIAGDLALGFERVFLHPVGGDPERFIDVFAEQVLPACGAR